MMNEYNRSDPFMYLMEKSQQAIERGIKNVIKMILLEIILFITASILNVTCGILMRKLGVPLLIQLCHMGMITFSFIRIRKCGKYTKKKDIQNMILSDTFRDINLNTEKVLMDTLIIHEGVGIANTVVTEIQYFIAVHILFIIYNIIGLILM